MDVDPLLVLRKTIRLLESLAAHEQAKGDRANLTKMADAMARAAQLSIASRRSLAFHIGRLCPRSRSNWCTPTPSMSG